MSITNLLVDAYTQEYINTIYDYQVAGDGETIEWDLVEYAPPCPGSKYKPLSMYARYSKGVTSRKELNVVRISMPSS